MAYATNSDMLTNYDDRTLGDLVNDVGVRQAPTQLQTDPVLAAMLSQASGMVNSACLYGQRYTVAELNGLTGDDQNVLKRLVCDLAFVYLANRRGVKPAQYEDAYTRSMEMLEMLKKGERLFNVAADVDTGVPQEDFPSVSAYAAINLLRDATNNRYFPVRRQQETSGN